MCCQYLVVSQTIKGCIAEENSVLDSELLKEYQDTFIIVNNWGGFQLSDLDLNDVRSVTLVPNFVEENFVTKFEGKLDRRPGVAPNVRCGVCSVCFSFLKLV